MGEYYIIITDAGVALEASAHAAGEPVVLTAFGVCDGGAAFTPDPTQTTLANEIDRWDISSLSVSPDDKSILIAQCIVPASSGGYTIRGIGIYAGDTLYAVGNYPDQPKPAPGSGYAASLEILAQLAVSDTADVTLNVTDGAWLTKEEGDQLYVPLSRKVNGHALTADVNVTAQDIFSGQAVEIGDATDLNSYTTPGLYYQPTIAQASTGKNYPEAVAGSLEVYKHAGITQIYRVYNSSRSYIRTLYSGKWAEWAKQYDTANKPSADDVGALPSAGGTVSVATTFNNVITLNSVLEIYAPQPYIDFHFGSSSADYTTRLIENTSGNLHVLGSFSASKTITPGDYSNFDTRYQAKGNYTPTGTAYTKTESDGRYPLKTATVIGARVGARGTLGSGNGDTDIEAPVGNFITGRVGSNGDVRYTKWYIRAFQINVNGTWKTITA